jgi:hypothetical protein
MRWLTQRLWLFIVFYAFLAVLFAIGFTMMPGQFYHSTITFEPETAILKGTLEHKLEKAIKRNMALLDLPCLQTSPKLTKSRPSFIPVGNEADSPREDNTRRVCSVVGRCIRDLPFLRCRQEAWLSPAGPPHLILAALYQ